MDSIKAKLRKEKLSDIVTSKVSDHALIITNCPSENCRAFPLDEIDALKRTFNMVKP